MPRRDPFTIAQCRKPGRDPALWDSEADNQQRAIARRLCRHCKAWSACATAVGALGPAASGTWAAEYYPWDGAAHNASDDTLTEYLAAFGPSSVHNDVTPDDQLEFDWEAI